MLRDLDGAYSGPANRIRPLGMECIDSPAGRSAIQRKPEAKPFQVKKREGGTSSLVLCIWSETWGRELGSAFYGLADNTYRLPYDTNLDILYTNANLFHSFAVTGGFR